MKKLLFSFLFSVVFGLFSSQSIGLIGEFNNWTGDEVLTTSDYITYTKTVTFSVSGSAKFRQNGAWTTNWGANAFPSGKGTQDGANIPVPAGTYNVTFTSGYV